MLQNIKIKQYYFVNKMELQRAAVMHEGIYKDNNYIVHVQHRSPFHHQYKCNYYGMPTCSVHLFSLDTLPCIYLLCKLYM